MEKRKHEEEKKEQLHEEPQEEALSPAQFWDEFFLGRKIEVEVEAAAIEEEETKEFRWF
ncbi:hypothetical protein [Bacillus coahuilensis]|uniref:hypothetical protein n=1 Tax=Bacillus coahuilensis TaxID=408580 RepID=UPI000B136EA2|nr:hypothetical protein [Bacillus coahuilensis]